MNKAHCLVGLDVGSTTVKIVAIESNTRKELYSDYRRHDTKQAACAAQLLRDAHKALPDREFSVSVCGSGGEPIAKALGAFFVQEVTALSTAVAASYPDARTAIELGGQDAKVVTFSSSADSENPEADAMRMNGVCAGGTGAFIDQIAALLNIPVTEFNSYAEKGSHVYAVSGRCGVFAKTDIQPLLNAGASRNDLALSCYHAIARQTIGGLAQGLTLAPDVIFAGGPFSFHPRLIEVFREKLSLTTEQAILPERPELLVARGSALSIETVFNGSESRYKPESVDNLEKSISRTGKNEGQVYFKSAEEKESFRLRHADRDRIAGNPARRLWLGVDAGSTTSKFVLIDDKGELVHSFYSNNHGDPLDVLFKGLREYKESRPSDLPPLRIAGIGVTGYGAGLMKQALQADYDCVETVAHARAAQQMVPDVSSIIDIGGQDMKVIFLENGVISDIMINEACSAGCGSFLESYAHSLQVPVDQIAAQAFAADSPANLGSRCTVFMNSAVISEQKQGRSREEILAGLCNSVIENIFTKLLRPQNINSLGDRIVVQGGTFRNDAVVRATELYLKKEVTRLPHAGHAGAVGAALLTMEATLNAEDETYESERLEQILSTDYQREQSSPCPYCSNHCMRSVVRFSHGGSFVSGNRCERGKDLKDSTTVKTEKPRRAPNLETLRAREIFREYPVNALCSRRNKTVGLPRVLELWETAPFWTTLFRSLGFDVHISKPTTQKQYEKGLSYVSSDTVCLPAKVSHGHVEELIAAGVDSIFLPQMIFSKTSNSSASGGFYCALLQGYSMVLENMHETGTRGCPLHHPTFHWYSDANRKKQIVDFLETAYGVAPQIARAAISQGDSAMENYHKTIAAEGQKVLQELKQKGGFGILLASRPYQSDRFIHHDVPRLFSDQGIPVLIPEALPEYGRMDLSASRMESTISYHNRVVEAAMITAEHPELELVQLVSFGCGHDAILADEAARILKRESGKTPLMMKLDEVSVPGPLQLRVDSFIETVRRRRRREAAPAIKREESAVEKRDYGPAFTWRDKHKKTIYAPNLSRAFSVIASAVFSKRGYRMETLPMADERAIKLGKRYVHNDICFPAQVNIGEFLARVESGKIDPDHSVLALAKNCESCRAGQYCVMGRKALDDAGLTQVPIITTGKDTKDLHPGFSLTIPDKIRLAWGITLTDELERMRRRLRPYEMNEGETDRIFEEQLQDIAEAIVTDSFRNGLDALRQAVSVFNGIELRPEPRRPRVAIIGEILMNYHSSANCNIERFLERHGMETVIPDLHLFFRKEFVINAEIAQRGLGHHPFIEGIKNRSYGRIMDEMRAKVVDVGKTFKYFESVSHIEDITSAVDGLVDLTYRGAEGWKIPGEIIKMSNEGIRSFVVIQPFGCLPNHITGRGFEKKLKQILGEVQIVSLDYDPDTSAANIENRLQMLVMREKMWSIRRGKNERNSQESA